MILTRRMTPEFLGLRMQNIQGTIFIWAQIYKEDFQICISVTLNFNNSLFPA